MSDKKKKSIVAQSLMESLGNLTKIASEEPKQEVKLEKVVIENSDNNEVSVVTENEVKPEEQLVSTMTSNNEQVNIKQEEQLVKESVQSEVISQNNNIVVEEKPQQQNEPQVTELVSIPKNVVVTYHNPLEALSQNYNAIQQKIAQEESEVMAGFRKRPPQSEIYCNATIQVRRDYYAAINEYILDARLGKTKVLNEIFQLGMDSFIKKYGKKQ
jgi:hypothetical protein